MTVLLDQAFCELSKSYSAQPHLEEPVAMPAESLTEEENWEDICEYRRLLDELDYLNWLPESEKIKNEQGRNTT